MADLWKSMRRLLERLQQISTEEKRCRKCGVCRHVCTLLKDTTPNKDAKALED